MGKICAAVFLTLDGVMEAPHVWHPPYVSEESLAVLARQMNASTAMLLGRRTYEELAAYWPHQPLQAPLSKATNAIHKYVWSQTLSKPEWQHTTVLTGNLSAVIRTLKSHDGDILVAGSAQLVQELLRECLLDELHITLDPIIVGSGRRLFPEESVTAQLELLDVRSLPHGVVNLVYVPRYPATAQGMQA